MILLVSTYIKALKNCINTDSSNHSYKFFRIMLVMRKEAALETYISSPDLIPKGLSRGWVKFQYICMSTCVLVTFQKLRCIQLAILHDMQ